MKKTLLALFLLCLSVTLTGCKNNNSLDSILKNGKIVVATNAEFPPFEYVDGDEITGFDIDLIKLYADYIGVKLEINNLDFDGALLSVSSGKADVAIAAVTKNPTREKSLSFSNGYFTANQVVIVKKNSPISGNTVEEIRASLSANKAVIGAQAGTVGEYYAKGDSDWEFDEIPNTTCQTYENGAMAIKALDNGQIDAVIIDQLPAEALSSSYSSLKILDATLTEEVYAIAVKKGNTSLVDSLNAFLEEIKKNGKLDELLNKYYFGA